MYISYIIYIYISIIRTLLIISVSAFFSPCSTHWPICRRLQLQRAPLVWRFAKDAHFFAPFRWLDCWLYIHTYMYCIWYTYIYMIYVPVSKHNKPFGNSIQLWSICLEMHHQDALAPDHQLQQVRQITWWIKSCTILARGMLPKIHTLSQADYRLRTG